jgi:Uma2 family endonuclease
MTISTKYTTAEELLALPDGKSFELYEGELRTVSPANFEHGSVAVQIAALLQQVVKPNDLGRILVECGFVLHRTPDTMLGPDVSFVRKSRLPSKIERSKFFEGNPDLAVEIISPTNSRREIEDKVKTYMRFGTPLAWVVDVIGRSVEVHRPGQPVLRFGEHQTITGSEIIPGFACVVSEFFA